MGRWSASQSASQPVSQPAIPARQPARQTEMSVAARHKAALELSVAKAETKVEHAVQESIDATLDLQVRRVIREHLEDSAAASILVRQVRGAGTMRISYSVHRVKWRQPPASRLRFGWLCWPLVAPGGCALGWVGW